MSFGCLIIFRKISIYILQIIDCKGQNWIIDNSFYFRLVYVKFT